MGGAKFIWGLVLLLFAIPEVMAQGYSTYVIYADIYQNDTAVLNSITAKNMDSSYFPGTPTGYNITVYSYDGSTLFDGNLPVSFNAKVDFVPGQANNPEMRTYQGLDKIPLLVRMPIDSEATQIAIRHGENTILEINLSHYFCNKDKSCDLGENRYICSDCQISENNRFFNPDWNLAILSIVIVVILVGVLVWKVNYSKDLTNN
jgi:hypothetical protein